MCWPGVPRWLERPRLWEIVGGQGGRWGWSWTNSQSLIKKLSSALVKRPGFLPQPTFQLHHFLAVTLGQLSAPCLSSTPERIKQIIEQVS